jgi:hypothetical protein
VRERGEQHFPTTVLQSRIVAIEGLFGYTSPWTQHERPTPDTALRTYRYRTLASYRLITSLLHACRLGRPYTRTAERAERERERERDESILDFVWILCIHPSTREKGQ